MTTLPASYRVLLALPVLVLAACSGGSTSASSGDEPPSCHAAEAGTCELDDTLTPLAPQPPAGQLVGHVIDHDGDLLVNVARRSEVDVWRLGRGALAWTRVDHATKAGDFTQYAGVDLASDGAGHLFTAGRICEDCVTLHRDAFIGLVRRSDDGGTSWKEVLTLPDGTGPVAAGGCEIYAAGGSSIARSTDGGVTWETVLEHVVVQGLAVASDGTAYAAAVGGPKVALSGLLRGSGAGTWRALPGALSGAVATLGEDVFTAGSRGADDGWIVEKSTDGGAHFSRLETYPGSSTGVGCEEQPTGIAANASGEIVVTGVAPMNDVCDGHSVVRQSHDAGATWRSVLAAGEDIGAPRVAMRADGSAVLSAGTRVLSLGCR